MSVDEKRALLASWASDACAVPNYPALRRLEDGRIVPIDDILDALKQLDGHRRDSVIRKGHWSRVTGRWRSYQSRDDDDDDPPTAPAAARPLRPLLDGAAAAA